MVIDKDCLENRYVNLYEELQGKKLAFPIFQRGFSWKEEQTVKILQDIETIINGKMFENSQIYLLDFIWFEENEQFKLADGQQRLITLNLLIKCLKAAGEKQNISLSVSEFDISYDDTRTNDKWQRFVGGTIEAPYKKVYLALEKWVDNHQNLITEIESVIKNNLFIYLKKAKDADDAFDVFEQINTGGKPLTKDEIIKTIISQYSAKYGIKIPASKKDIKTMLTSYYKYTDDDTEGAFNSIAIMSFLNRKVVGDRLTFQKFADYVTFAKKAQESSMCYVVELIKRTQLRDIIYIYEAQGKKLKDNRSIIDEILMPLALQCIIWTLSGTSPAGRVKTYLDHIVNMVKQKKSVKEINEYILFFADNNKDICHITFDTFKNHLRGKNKQNVLEALIILDVIMSNTSGELNISSINLEHVYPQRPRPEWGSNGWPMNIDEQHEYIHNIGNYLILNQSVNKKIKNKYIADKRIEYNRIIPKDKFLQTPLNTVDFDAFENSKTYIDARREKMAEYIRDNFPLAKAFIQMDTKA